MFDLNQANAFIEDRQRCLAAGMDDFVAKPVDPKVLYAKLAEWLPGAADASHLSASQMADAGVDTHVNSDQNSAASVIHQDAGLKFFNGNTANYLRTLSQFSGKYADYSRQIRENLDNHDKRTAERLAHTLKGIAATLGMEQLHIAMLNVETDIHAGKDDNILSADLNAADHALSLVIDEIDGLKLNITASHDVSPDNTKLKLLIDKLESQLAEDNPDAIETWRLIQSPLSCFIPPSEINALDENIGKFSLLEALKQLRTLIKSLPI